MGDQLAVILGAASGLLASACVVFRVLVRRDYLQKGRLTGLTSALELLVFAGLMSFPYLFNPPEWPWFWRRGDSGADLLGVTGLAIILLGFLSAFGTMLWFGMRRAFGLQVDGLVRNGPYRFSRNPQILGGYLLVGGAALQWSSWYSLGWVILYAITCHWMILSEEEHLRRCFGQEYRRYCAEVPRYLSIPGGR